MGSVVRYHPATFAEFFEPIDVRHQGLSAKLAEDFKVYMDSGRGIVPHYFGRDAPYMRPREAESAHLSHIHIKLPPGKFRQDVAQYHRVCSFNDPQHDAALVYVRGDLEEDRFLLLAFFWPDAHGVARKEPLMRYLCQLAKDWRDMN
ncbi:type II toxin-antitoxin system YafO family toxin [Pseudomonas petrae]|uniref:type II toxin-antitoxin system YafO family toxin n=1 Tax=Pseudomonas petrae TaxID=2912190 RepID=UPI001F3E463C|nr:type II toxin-antitoxin system YafO family toxin [Pseudomonas petrae]MCF7532005.1 type II toxin-antitoxin system YafO family toxin [Pseudomonas petrae]